MWALIPVKADQLLRNKMILVIFGAGASYDSVPSRPPRDYPRPPSGTEIPGISSRPPLANELFLDTNSAFVDSISKFQQCYPIVPLLQKLPVDKTLEQVLETLQSEAEDDVERKIQLAAVRYYLHMFIRLSEDRWTQVSHGITNYVTLLDQLRRSRSAGEPVCLVTFNYDRMIEDALHSVGVNIENIDDYISHDSFKLFKLHGSVNWAREVEKPIGNVANRSEWDVAYELIRRVGELVISNRFRVVQEAPIAIGRLDGTALFPAIAIPVETKKTYECPDDHLACLEGYLPKIKKILIIGWRGAEQHFLALLKKTMRERIPTYIVAGGKKEGNDVIENIEMAGIRGVRTVFPGGFSEFIISREAEKFLKV